MGVLTYRAEQALLGAMIADPGLVGRLGYLEPGDFAWNAHRMLHQGMCAAARAGRISTGSWREAVAAAGPGYLDELRAACPEPLHGPAYGAMVMQASARRTVVSLADDLAVEAGTFGYDAARLVRAVGTAGHETDGHARHLAQLAVAMRSHGAGFNPDTALGPAGPARVLSGERPRPATPATSAAGDVGVSEAALDRERERAEERVLAALIQGHRETRQIVTLLPGSAFGDALRREIFSAIWSLYTYARPVDALTVDWEVTRARASLSGQEAGNAPRAVSEESYVGRLARTSVGDGPVTRTADFLLTRFSRAGNGRPPTVTGQVRALRSVPRSAPQPDPGQVMLQPPGHPGPGREPRR
jgi:hypothetical protein